MKKVDTLIVGLGLAGLAYAETLYRNNRSFHVIDRPAFGSSVVAGGIYNPTLLKRFTMTWMGGEFYQTALPFYRALENRFQTTFLFPAPIKKIFNSQRDHNDWSAAADRVGLSDFLDPSLHFTPLDGVKTPFGHGVVRACGRLDIPHLLTTYAEWLGDRIDFTPFDHDRLQFTSSGLRYGGIVAQRIVFCEGYKMKSNPYFNALPLQGSKGQILLIHCPDLAEDTILKGPLFLAPLGDHLFWAGASYEPHDKSLELTQEAREGLEKNIRKMIDVPFEVRQQLTQIRPTVSDRRPLIGQHPRHGSLFLLNGMGSRGVLTAPLAAAWLYASIDAGVPLLEAVDITRFKI